MIKQVLYSCLLSRERAPAPTRASSEVLVVKPTKKQHIEKVKNPTGREGVKKKGLDRNRFTGQ